MKASIIDRIKAFQAEVVGSEVARSVIAAPSPNLLLTLESTSEEISEDILFARVIDEKEIVAVCRDLYVSGFYNLAVAEAFKVIDRFVQDKADRGGVSGTALMDQVFSPKAPMLVWSDRATISEKDEQTGYHRLFSGAMLGLRNPCAHEHDWIDEATSALESIILAQHLLKKAKKARKSS